MRAGCARLMAALIVVSTSAVGCSSSEDGSASRPSDSSSSATPTPTPTDAPPSDETPAGSVRLALLPGVAQPGSAPAQSLDTPLFVATLRPASPGSEVLLQRRDEEGWETVSRARQDDAGIARWAQGLSVDASTGTYRAVAVEDGTPGVESNAVDGVSWESAFADEFDGDALDTSRWNYRNVGVYNIEDDGRCSKSDPSAAQVSGGALQLQVRLDPARTGEPCRTPDFGTLDYYLNGRIDTEGNFGFTRGVAAARVKFQEGRGQHGAFWLQSAAPVPGVPALTGAEVDVAEFFGDGAAKGGMGTYVFYTDAQGEKVKVGGLQPDATKLLPPGETWWSHFHVFSVEWTPEEYVYRVDGREIFRTSRGLSGVDEFLVLSLSTKDWELDKLDPSLLPSTMQVDWVRVWQRPAS